MVWDETELIVWAAVGQGFEDRPEPRIAFARALHSNRSDLLRELLLPNACDDAWLQESARSGLRRLHRACAPDGPVLSPATAPDE